MIRLHMWTISLGSIATMACSAPDPGVGYLGPSPAGSTNGADAGEPTPVDAGSTAPIDSGTASPVVDSGTAVVDSSFLGETIPFSALSAPTETAFEHHAAGGQAKQTPITDCLTCHVQANGIGAPPFLAAGYVGGVDGGCVEVRVYAGGGTSPAGYSAWTDTNGYFWINPPVTPVGGPYNAAARNANGVQFMTEAAALDCQTAGCHGGAQGPIRVP